MAAWQERNVSLLPHNLDTRQDRHHNLVLLCKQFHKRNCPHASSADGLAWDWVNRKLYWTDAVDKEIEVIDTLSTHRKLLISTGTLSIPRAIVVDPQKR